MTNIHHCADSLLWRMGYAHLHPVIACGSRVDPRPFMFGVNPKHTRSQRHYSTTSFRTAAYDRPLTCTMYRAEGHPETSTSRDALPAGRTKPPTDFPLMSLTKTSRSSDTGADRRNVVIAFAGLGSRARASGRR